MKVNKKLLVLLVINFLLLAAVASLIVGDIQAGVLRGEPETGWGIVIAEWIFGPPLLVLGIINFFMIRSLKSNGQSVAKTVKLAILTASLIILFFSVYSHVEHRRDSEAMKQKEARAQQIAESNKPKAISVDEAITLLNGCKLDALYYGGIIKSEEIKNELNIAGNQVVLVRVNGEPYNIQIADTAKSTLLPVAKNAEKLCAGFTVSGN